jgi:NADH-quinone oxidoreductase subunit L
MAGPTPVSALIHAATMVTSGVYMVARMGFLYEQTPVALTVVAVVGVLTAVFAATIGLTQFDIKKVLAYSTVSQLGYMFLGVGTGAFAAGLFHVVTHAFFKALLFLGSGSVIHALSGEQDIRKMGGLYRKIPVTAKTFLFGWLAICGIVPFAGFFSKDEILWKAFSTPNTVLPWLPPVLWVLAFLAAGLTAAYMTRLVALTFFGKSRLSPEVEHHVHESPASMTGVLAVLAVLSAIGGFLSIPHYLESLLPMPEVVPALEKALKRKSLEGGFVIAASGVRS